VFLQENRWCTPDFRGKNIVKWGVPGQVCPGNSISGGCFENFFEDLSKSGFSIELSSGCPHFSMFFIQKQGVSEEFFPRTPILGM